MITKQTVFILGAGASAPYGFPLGKELVDRIIHELNPEPTDNRKAIECICKAADNYWSSVDLEDFRKSLVTSREQSIDAFLQHHPNFMRQGKAAIAWMLLNAESSNAQLRPSKEHKDKDWYPQLRDLLSASFDEFQNNKAAFLTFNFDRSLEQFLFTTLSSRQSGKARPADWAAKLRECLPIVHLHGELGIHPAFAESDDKEVVEFGASVTPASLRAASRRIRNVHDSVDLDSDPAFQQAYRLISQADFICFLGFAYDERNIAKLRLRLHCKGVAVIFGTGMDLTKEERARIQEKSIGKILAESILPMDCVTFLRNSRAIQTIYERS
ncbi:MAG: hypothetical protein HY343_07575 [Lentisphaerae bacterium]|nr:hypothetical protein [Lentisphaerota bacterium]